MHKLRSTEKDQDVTEPRGDPAVVNPDVVDLAVVDPDVVEADTGVAEDPLYVLPVEQLFMSPHSRFSEQPPAGHLVPSTVI